MSKLNFTTIFLALVIFDVVHSDQFRPEQFEQCGSKGQVISVDIPGCSKFPCVLKKGSDYEIGINFKTHSAGDSLKAKVTGILFGMEMPWPGGPNENACENIEGPKKCPFASGDELHYKVKIHINPSYPSVSVTAKWRISDNIDTEENDHLCIKIPLKISN